MSGLVDLLTRSFVSGVGRKVAYVAVAAVATLAATRCHGYGGIRSEIDASRSIVSASRATSTDLVVQGAGSTTRVTGAVTITGPGGQVVGGSLQTQLTKKAVAGIAGRVIGHAIPVVGAGLIILELADHIRAKPDVGGGIIWDEGQAPKVYQCWKVHEVSTQVGCSASMAAALATAAAKYNSNNTGDDTSGCQVTTVTWSSGTSFVNPNNISGGGNLVRSSTFNNCGTVSSGAPTNVGVTGFVQSDYTACPRVIGWTGPAEYMAEGGSIQSDGKCPTGSYTTPLTPEQAALKAETHSAAQQAQEDYPAMMREAAGLSPEGAPMPIGTPDAVQEIVPGSVTPSSLAGPTTVTQNPDGTSTTELTGWNFRRREDTGYKNQGLWDKTSSTILKDGNGLTISTKTSTTTPGDVGAAAGETNSDPCAAGTGTAAEGAAVVAGSGGANRILCAEMGEVPDDVEVEKKDLDAGYSPDTGWGAETASCPAPQTKTFLGMSVPIDNSLLCQFLAGVRVFVIGAAAIAAALLFVGGVRE